MARRTVCCAVAVSSSVVHFVSGANSAWWSICIWTVRFRHFRPIFPVKASTGTRSSHALPTPVVRFVAPGPSVERHAPGRPVSRAHTSAMKPAQPSCVTSTNSTPVPSIARMNRMFCPPGQPKTYRIPARSSSRTTTSDVVSIA